MTLLPSTDNAHDLTDIYLYLPFHYVAFKWFNPWFSESLILWINTCMLYRTFSSCSILLQMVLELHIKHTNTFVLFVTHNCFTLCHIYHHFPFLRKVDRFLTWTSALNCLFTNSNTICGKSLSNKCRLQVKTPPAEKETSFLPLVHQH